MRDRSRVVDPNTGAAEVLASGEIHNRLAELVLLARPDTDAEPAKAGWFVQSLVRYRAALAHVVVASAVLQLFAIATRGVVDQLGDRVCDR